MRVGRVEEHQVVGHAGGTIRREPAAAVLRGGSCNGQRTGAGARSPAAPASAARVELAEHHVAAPRERASNPSAPVPANGVEHARAGRHRPGWRRAPRAHGPTSAGCRGRAAPRAACPCALRPRSASGGNLLRREPVHVRAERAAGGGGDDRGRRGRPWSGSAASSAAASSRAWAASSRWRVRRAWRRSGIPLCLAASTRALAAQLEIDLGELEPVGGPRHRVEPAPGLVGGRIGEQHAEALVRAAPDPAAQLVQLGEAEQVGPLDHHQRGVRARRRPPRSPSSRPAPAHRPRRNASIVARRSAIGICPCMCRRRSRGARRRAGGRPRTRPPPRPRGRTPTRTRADRRRRPGGPRRAAGACARTPRRGGSRRGRG